MHQGVIKSGESSANSSVKALPTKPMGMPLLIGEEVDQQVQEFRVIQDRHLIHLWLLLLEWVC